MWLLALVFALCMASAAQAQEIANPDVIAAETRFLGDLPGPDGRTPRGLTIWRAPSTPGDVLLPTVYVTDGARGVYLIAARLRAPIEARLMAPVQVIGLDPHPTDREAEYGRVGRARYRAHERWVIEVVIPWAERVARADPHRRVIAGYSNGADFALAMVADHPDLFTGVLAHSPVATERLRLDARAGDVRWAISAGRTEMNGYAALSLSIAEAAAREQGAAVRRCSGTWAHEYATWSELTPGAVAWLFAFDADVATQLERDACTVIPRR